MMPMNRSSAKGDDGGCGNEHEDDGHSRSCVHVNNKEHGACSHAKDGGTADVGMIPFLSPGPPRSSRILTFHSNQ